MPDVKYLFFHTAASDQPNIDAAEIDRWHRQRGFREIGYHYVIIDDRHSLKRDGEVEVGRSENETGAHVQGVNSISLGVCCVGHGDLRDFTSKQKQALVRLLSKLANKYNVKTKNILGHREINKLIEQGKVSAEFRTDKSCPGRKVSVDEIRSLVARERGEASTEAASRSASGDRMALREALAYVASNEEAFGNAIPEWRSFFYNGEVRAIMQDEREA